MAHSSLQCLVQSEAMGPSQDCGPMSQRQHLHGVMIPVHALQLMDMLVEQTHEVRYEWRNNERPLRFTDIRVDEQARGISLKSTPMSLVLEASSGKSFVMNLLDTPGRCGTLVECACCVLMCSVQHCRCSNCTTYTRLATYLDDTLSEATKSVLPGTERVSRQPFPTFIPGLYPHADTC